MTKNYARISLLSTSEKEYERTVIERVKKISERKIRKEQRVLKKGRGLV